MDDIKCEIELIIMRACDNITPFILTHCQRDSAVAPSYHHSSVGVGIQNEDSLYFWHHIVSVYNDFVSRKYHKHNDYNIQYRQLDIDNQHYYSVFQ